MRSLFKKIDRHHIFRLFRTFALASAIYAVIALLAMSTLFFVYQNKLINARAEAQLGIFTITESLQSSIDQIKNQLTTLSRNPAITQAITNPAACTQALQDIQNQQDSIENIALAGTDLQIICSAVPIEVVPATSNDPNQEIIQYAHDFHIGYITQGLRRGTYTIPMGTVLYDNDMNISGFLYVTLSLDWLNTVLQSHTKASNALITVLDAKGTIIGRSIDRTEWTGVNIAETEPYKNVILNEMTRPVLDLTGRSRIIFSSKIGSTHEGFISVAYGVDIAQIQQSFASQQRNLIIALISVYFLLLLALWKEDTRTLQEKQWRILAENAPVHIVFTDIDGKIVFGNREAEKITGYTVAEMMGQTPRLWGGLMKKSFYKKLWDTIKYKKQSFHGEITNRRKNGQEYLADARIAPALSKSGDVLGFVGIERDITEERNAQNELREHDAIQTTFLQVLMHRLRTPLGVVRWNIEQLTNGDLGPLSKKQLLSLDIAHQASVETNMRVSSMLNAIAVKNNNLAINRRNIDLVEVVQKITAKHENHFKNKNIRTNVHINLPDPSYLGDEQLLENAFDYLVDNAAQYTQAKGKVEISLHRQNGDIIFTVKDTGIGIPATEKHRVFQLFFRGSNATSLNTEGYGINLFLAKSYIEVHNGTLTVQSKENKGSTFTVKLPVA